MIYSFLNQKGGVGKTTLAVNVASELTQDGSRVLVVDADPQGSALDWAAAREDRSAAVTVVGFPRATLHKDIANMAEGYDHVVIDGPPRVTDLARSAILASDVVVIPIQPSPYDVWAAREVSSLIEESRVYRDTLKSVFLVNRKIVNTAIGRDVRKALQHSGSPVMEAYVSQRVVFAESAARGLAVREVDETCVAAEEVRDVTKELRAI